MHGRQLTHRRNPADLKQAGGAEAAAVVGALLTIVAATLLDKNRTMSPNAKAAGLMAGGAIVGGAVAAFGMPRAGTALAASGLSIGGLSAWNQYQIQRAAPPAPPAPPAAPPAAGMPAFSPNYAGARGY